MSALFCMVRWFDSSRRFSGFCGSPRGFCWLFDNFIGDSVKRASRGLYAVAPMAAYRRGLIQAFIRRFKRLLWLRGYCSGNSFKCLYGASRGFNRGVTACRVAGSSVSFSGSVCGLFGVP